MSTRDEAITALEELLGALMWASPRLKRELLAGLARDRTIKEAEAELNRMKVTLRRMIKGLKREAT